MSFFDVLKKNVELANRDLEEKSNDNDLDQIQESLDSDGPFENNSPEKAHNFRYLDELIHLGLKEIILDSDITLGPDEEDIYKNGISLDAGNVVIDGAGHAIDAREKVRIFNINADNVVLRNIKFENGFFKSEKYGDRSGGAICVVEHPLTIENCDFINNSASGKGSGGGAIFNIKNSLNIVKSNFIDNYVFEGAGGAIYVSLGEDSSLTLEECTFESNHINTGRGGALFVYEGISILKDCTFDSNFTYEGNGAAIFNNGSNLSMEKCEFKNNSAATPSSESYYKAYGASIYTEGFLKCDTCIFCNNVAMEGSAIYNFNNDVEVRDSVFDDTSSASGSVILQLNADGNLSVENSTFKVSYPKEEIMRIVDGFCFIKKSKFYSNNAENKAYAIFNQNATVTLENSQFFDETGNKVIYNNNELWIRKKDNLEDKIKDGKDSNHINYLKEGIDSDIKGFTYLDEIIRNADGSEILLDEDIVINDAEKFFFEGGIELNLDNITIDGQNHIIDARGLSRIFYITSKNVTLKNIVFKNGMYFKNHLDEYEYSGGGAIYAAHDTSFSLINCKFIKNESRVSGGALFNKGEIKMIEGCDFIENSAREYGTVSSINGTFTLHNCVFNRNSTMLGGGIYVSKGEVSLSDSTFTDNLAKMYGGAVFIKNAVANIKKSKFRMNTTDEGMGGGAIFNENATLSVLDSSFERNVGFNGGAINSSGSVLIVENSLFKDNFAKSRVSHGDGDAIFSNRDFKSEKPPKISIKNCVFNGGNFNIIKNAGILDIFSADFNDDHIIENKSLEDESCVILHGEDIISRENVHGGDLKISKE